MSRLSRASLGFALTLCLVTLSGALATAPAATPRPNAQSILKDLVRAGVPGVAVYLHDRRGNWSGASGLADLRGRVRMRANFHVRIASVTKTFTATIVLQLVGEGKLRLEDTVERWLPGLVRGGGEITIEDLLRHTSGIADFDDPGGLLSPTQVVALPLAQPPLFRPGSAWSYSSTNYILLGLIVEAATHSTFARELRERILSPVRLSQTSFERDSADTEMPTPFAHGYSSAGAREPPHDVTSQKGHWASGGIVSTVADIGRFYRALLGGRLLPPVLRDRMLTTRPANPADGYEVFGLGIGASRLYCGRVAWGHFGGLPGFQTEVMATKTGSRLVVVVVNVGDSWAIDPTYAATGRLFCAR